LPQDSLDKIGFYTFVHFVYCVRLWCGFGEFIRQSRPYKSFTNLNLKTNATNLNNEGYSFLSLVFTTRPRRVWLRSLLRNQIGEVSHRRCLAEKSSIKASQNFIIRRTHPSI